MVGKTFCMECMQAYLALENILVLFDVLLAPMAQVMIDKWTGPFITACLHMAWMEAEIAVSAMLRDNRRD